MATHDVPNLVVYGCPLCSRTEKLEETTQTIRCIGRCCSGTMQRVMKKLSLPGSFQPERFVEPDVGSETC